MFRLIFIGTAEDMPTDGLAVLKVLREIVENGTLGGFELDSLAPVCQVAVETGECVQSSSASLLSATVSSSILDRSSSLELTSYIQMSSSLALESSPLSSFFESSTGLLEQPSSAVLAESISSALALESQSQSSQPFVLESSAVPLVSSSGLSSDIGPASSSFESSAMIMPSLVSSDVFEMSSSALLAAPLQVESAMRITSVEYTEELANKSSDAFKALQSSFCGNVRCCIVPDHVFYLSFCVDRANIQNLLKYIQLHKVYLKV